ncbi:enoyl-CoA hydratase-related protein [Niveispirillum sp.]|uniref:enoyl-CoA hydratase-related protein n=1 Tax=Niveispirillum sp. TaxID=1917217 RepID=UPI001B6AE849|nr:enoyl-CoA hydratase-related protein [Niveispirillum sp.]MBP7339613.1 enoyl-CoA hydratase/isomerase family protein [Niveispirillum sp.]
MTDKPDLLIERPEPGLLLLRLNRPERRNALATPLLSALADALAAAVDDPDVRAVIITGDTKVFAAGADIRELAASGPDDPPHGPRQVAWDTIRHFPKPLIAAVEGWCLGAGCELLMCCDLSVAGTGAQFGQPESSLGIIPGAGGTATLTRLVGRTLAMRMVLTGESITAERALAAGLVGELVPAGQALDRALDLARLIAGRAPLALAAAKASVRATFDLHHGEHLRDERRYFLALLGTEDKREGVTAFLEKRKPQWQGR